jgi:hypothetical protein
MTKDELDKAAKLYIVTAYNYEQDQAFKNGGIPMPKFKSYEEMEKFSSMMKSLFPSTDKRFSEPTGEIVFDIPDKYNGC